MFIRIGFFIGLLVIAYANSDILDESIAAGIFAHKHGDKVHHRGIDWSSLLLRPDSPEYLPLPTLRPEDGWKGRITIEPPVIGELMRSSSLQENNADAGIYANKDPNTTIEPMMIEPAIIVYPLPWWDLRRKSRA